MTTPWAAPQLLQREQNLVKCYQSHTETLLYQIYGQNNIRARVWQVVEWWEMMGMGHPVPPWPGGEQGWAVQKDQDGWIKEKHFLSLRTSDMDWLTAILPMSSLPPSPFPSCSILEQSKMESESRLIAARQSGVWWHDFLDPLFMPLYLASEGP